MHNEIQKLEEDLEKKEEAMKGVEDELDKQGMSHTHYETTFSLCGYWHNHSVFNQSCSFLHLFQIDFLLITRINYYNISFQMLR